MHKAAMTIGAKSLHLVVVADTHTFVMLPHRCRLRLLFLTIGLHPPLLRGCAIIATHRRHSSSAWAGRADITVMAVPIRGMRQCSVGVVCSAPSPVSLYRHRSGWLMLLNGLPRGVESMSIVSPFPILLAATIPIAEDGVAKLNRFTQLVKDHGVKPILVHVRLDVRLNTIPRIHELGLKPIDVVILKVNIVQ